MFSVDSITIGDAAGYRGQVSPHATQCATATAHMTGVVPKHTLECV